MKKKIIAVTLAAVSLFATTAVQAREMGVYVKNHYVWRDVQRIGKYDMLPILDIAGELGFNCSFDGTNAQIYNDSKTYKFTVGKASVFDESGNWYGLDVVPKMIGGKLYLPHNFFISKLGLSYTYDSVTDTLFLGSDNTYKWLIGTSEYKAAASGKSSSSGTSSSNKSSSYYPNSPFRTFTSAVGLSLVSTSASNGGTIYEYGYTDLQTIYTYISILQNGGATYYGSEERGSTLLVCLGGENNSMLIIAYDTSTGKVKISVS